MTRKPSPDRTRKTTRRTRRPASPEGAPAPAAPAPTPPSPEALAVGGILATLAAVAAGQGEAPNARTLAVELRRLAGRADAAALAHWSPADALEDLRERIGTCAALLAAVLPTVEETRPANRATMPLLYQLDDVMQAAVRAADAHLAALVASRRGEPVITSETDEAADDGGAQ